MSAYIPRSFGVSIHTYPHISTVDGLNGLSLTESWLPYFASQTSSILHLFQFLPVPNVPKVAPCCSHQPLAKGRELVGYPIQGWETYHIFSAFPLSYTYPLKKLFQENYSKKNIPETIVDTLFFLGMGHVTILVSSTSFCIGPRCHDAPHAFSIIRARAVAQQLGDRDLPLSMVSP